MKADLAMGCLRREIRRLIIDSQNHLFLLKAVA
jgi:hypothetical protein